MKKSYVYGLLVALLGVAACQSDNSLTPAQDGTKVATSSTSLATEGATATSSGVITGSINTANASSSPMGARAASAALQQEILTYLNAARSKSCLCGSTTYPAVPALALNTKLTTASDKFALDLATYNYFSHTGRDGSQPWDRMTREGYVWRAAGENIAAGYPTARAVVDGWLKSPGHCANIMSANFKEVGVGYAYTTTSTYKHYWVTDFGTQR
ncbi:CAP domain-containing protein [Fibrella aquatilis]|uniref:CAP domain-containing protein n=1 Tax=Fibrella aquatilis TaxID=2817059 RepID=A0A939JZM0_9BACT|nr:CAP domain-containing protein [Fibrella aquatilis]MBO0931553.1 CAP domain-containing protein [Fibrella aquatilis]